MPIFNIKYAISILRDASTIGCFMTEYIFSSNLIFHICYNTHCTFSFLREYLIWNGYSYTDQTLLTESGQCGEKPSREHLAARLGVIDDRQTAKIPLLYYVVSAFTQQGEEEEAP